MRRLALRKVLGLPRLKVLNGPAKGHVCEIVSDSCSLGREATCELQVLDRGASRRHAEIFRLGNMYFIKDLDSRNGTIVNDKPVKQELLMNGDHVIIGNTILLYESDEGAASGFPEAAVEGEEELGFPSADFTEEGTNTLELRLEDIADPEASAVGRAGANFRAVYRLGRIVTRGKSEDELLNEIFDFIHTILPADNVYLFLRDEQSGKLLPRLYRERVRGAGVSRSIIRRALSEARSILTTDASRDVRFKAEKSELLNRVRSVICVPLSVQEQVNGVFYMASLNPDRPFNEEDLQLMTVVGTLVGTALHGLVMSRRQHETFFSAIRTLVSVSELRDPTSQGHAERVARWAFEISRRLQHDERTSHRLRLAALLHDIGKAAVPQQTSQALATSDLDKAREHVIFGAQLAGNIVGAEEIGPAIRHHHERCDGSGFPEGLVGDAIPQFARVIAVADHMDHAVGTDISRQRLAACREALGVQAGKAFDSQIVQAALGVLEALEAHE